EIYAAVSKEREEHLQAYNGLLNGDLTRVNTLARRLEMPTVVVPDFADDYQLSRDSQPQPGVPQGKLTQYRWESKIFPGTVRDYWVYVPAQYDAQQPACVM